jgi:hypothetical protein
MKPSPIPGCRQDILGHNLKPIDLLRVLAICADADHRDAGMAISEELVLECLI